MCFHHKLVTLQKINHKNMAKKAFQRIYKNNSMYAADKLPYIDALALTVQKNLYTKKNAVYYLAGTIELWDFMSLTRCYIIASRSEFGQSDIETYISSMYDQYAQMFDDKAVEYTKNLDYITLYGTPANVLSLMWAAWIYAKVLHEVCKDDEKPLWQKAAEQLYNSMEDFYDSLENKCFGDNNSLLSIADDAVNTMKGYITEKYPTAKNTQVQKPAPAVEHHVLANDDTAKLDSRIAELEEENASLKHQLEEKGQSQPQASETQEERNDEWQVELLSHLMYESESNAKAFLEKVRGMRDTEIADVVAEWVKDNKISSKSCRRDLWRILHAAKLYDGTESNYNQAMFKRQ